MQNFQSTVFSFHFENSSNHEVRTIVKADGSIWFVAKDVCEALQIKNARHATTRLDDDEEL